MRNPLRIKHKMGFLKQRGGTKKKKKNFVSI